MCLQKSDFEKKKKYPGSRDIFIQTYLEFKMGRNKSINHLENIAKHLNIYLIFYCIFFKSNQYTMNSLIGRHKNKMQNLFFVTNQISQTD